MKLKIFLFIIISVFLISCNNKNAPRVLSSANLESTILELNSDSAYRIRTTKGTLIEISPNSFDVKPHTKIKVEIKEAYSMQDILLAGLSTQNNGKPLRSAGMIYFHATADGREVGFLKPVQATTPATIYDSAMQVYDAEIGPDSALNWVAPRPTDTTPHSKELAIGKSLFLANCASCHNPLTRVTGPALAGARRRSPTNDWAYRFVNNTFRMTKEDPYGRSLFNKYGTYMPQFHLPFEGIQAILDYCDNEQLLALSKNADSANLAAEQCGYDTVYFSKPKPTTELLTLGGNSSAAESPIDTNSITVSTPIPSPPDEQAEEFAKKGYKYSTPTIGLYKFNIERSGWYNIDTLFAEPNCTSVQLYAEIEGSFNNDMNVYLCIPKRKILMEARMHNGNFYIFDHSNANGIVQMIPGDGAFIIATATIDNKIYFGIKKFDIKKQQTIRIAVKEANREQILSAIRSDELDGLQLDLETQEMQIIERNCDEQRPPVSDSTIFSAAIEKAK